MQEFIAIMIRNQFDIVLSQYIEHFETMDVVIDKHIDIGGPLITDILDWE